MQTIELKTRIDHHREIHLQLPANAREGMAWVTVRYEETEPHPVHGNLDDFLDKLRMNASGRSRADILKQVQEEREGWGD